MSRSKRRTEKTHWLALNWPERIDFRARLAGEQGWRCCYCGCRMIHHGRHPDSVTLHLLLPGQLEGSYSYDNCVACCRMCSESPKHRHVSVEDVAAMAIGTAMPKADVYAAILELQLERAEDGRFRAAA